MLLFLNLTGHGLTAPVLGIDPNGIDTTLLVQLLTGGWATNPLFGGSGPDALSMLDGFDVWATLIPENGTIFNATVAGAGVQGLSGLDLTNGQFAFITQVAPPGVPEPGTLLLIGIASLWLMAARRRRVSYMFG